MARKLRRSSGNVFRDLGFSAEEAENLRIRSELMARLHRIIEDQDLTQGEAAQLLGVSQPRVSALVRGKIDLFSIDALVTMLSRVGLRVTVTARARKRVA
jgi:predicted XRE-type DNA-binding protein